MTVYTYPYQYHPDNGTFSGAWHADYSAANPSFVVATLAPATDYNPKQTGYSRDGCYTWNRFPTIPLNSTHVYTTFGAGSLHVGTESNIIWVSASSHGVYRSTDHGSTWTALSIPGVTTSTLNTQAVYYYRRPIAFEKTAASADTVYAHAPSNGFYKSTDGGATWTQQCSAAAVGAANWTQSSYLKSVPDHPGHLFNTPGAQGNYPSFSTTLPFVRTTDGGATWTQVAGITSVRGFDFGMHATGQTYPAIYAVGVVAGVFGVYRSDDNAATWTQLTTQPNNTVDFIRNVGASKETYGLHWITTGGSGLIRGALT